MIQTTYRVEGMTCQHCVNSVTGELTAIPGVTAVIVDLVSGGTSKVQVTSESELAASDVAAAVAEAGYALA